MTEPLTTIAVAKDPNLFRIVKDAFGYEAGFGGVPMERTSTPLRDQLRLIFGRGDLLVDVWENTDGKVIVDWSARSVEGDLLTCTDDVGVKVSHALEVFLVRARILTAFHGVAN